ncbi:replication endonuclease [Neisseria sp. S1]|uniref:replication endonuclease n=1 Tax=Neisseria sp. S1 TaxID=3318354 RepID=UPI003A87E766
MMHAINLQRGKLFECGRWQLPSFDLQRAINKHLPPRIEQRALARYLRHANRPSENPRRGLADDPQEAAAAAELAQTVGYFANLPDGLFGTSSDIDIRNFAEKTAEKFRQAVQLGIGLPELIGRALALGIDTARVFERKTPKGIYARLQDDLFWRRQFRRLVARALEQALRDVGLVSRATGLYASNEAVSRARASRARNAALMAAVNMVNELGQEFALSELVEKSNANPAIRRAELMVRIAGFEEVARGVGHVGEFITITCPSRFHAAYAEGGQENPNYDHSSPRDAAAYLQKVWSRVRAQLKREGVEFYGFRIAEPHHDGCPHWHGLFFMSPKHRLRFRQVLAMHACREDRGELNLRYCRSASEARAEARRRQEAMSEWMRPAGKKVPTIAQIMADIKIEDDFWAAQNFKDWKGKKASRRVDFVDINWQRGTAAGYIAKYIAKNIDGRRQDGESAGNDYEAAGEESFIETAERVYAWASTWGIRQFQQVGGAPVSVWRELRRLDVSEDDYNDVIVRAAMAADSGDWAKFTAIMGNSGRRALMPLALYKEDGVGENKYGEPRADSIRGVIEKATGLYKISRIHEWVSVFNGGKAAAWTCVNNCTNRDLPAGKVYTAQEIEEIISRCEPVPLSDIDFINGKRKLDKKTPWHLTEEEAEAAIEEAKADLIRQEEDSEWRQYVKSLAGLKQKTSAAICKPSGLIPPEPIGVGDIGKTRLRRLLPLPGKGKTVAQIRAESRARIEAVETWLEDLADLEIEMDL